ncbi:MAG: hypothetical protein K2R98_06025 [Gemmataceae bacterium]|nr:hypothetical protein [Gemmataceae bacterium]
MAFRDFTFPQVQERLGLRVQDADLYSAAEPFAVRPEVAAFIQDGVALALANSTEKAKSEFIIAPVLLELRRSLGPRFVLFSGVEWDVDSSRGLNGYCDFIVGRGPSQHILQSPYVAIVVAKNDLIRSGLGQCIAAMYAAWLSNEHSSMPTSAVHGVVSTGAAWKFLRLQGDVVTMDTPEYFIDNLPKIMGILRCIVESTH